MLQGRLAAGQVRLKDGGERLRASVAAAATDLAAGLHALEATGKVETPWAHTAFERSTLSFIDAEGRTQVMAPSHLLFELFWDALKSSGGL